MKKRVLLASAAMALTFALSATPAMAGSNAELLKRLHEKGILTDEEYQSLLADDSAQVATAPAAPPAQAAAASLDDKRLVRMSDSGIGMEVGGVTVKLSGSVNGFYTHDNGQAPGPNTAVVGGVVPAGGSSSAIRNGLLPGYLKFDVTTNQGGWDVGAHFGMYPGINSADYSSGGGANAGGRPVALQTAGIDFRQTYMTIGRAGLGEFKLGRDIGLFGSEGILNDITLLSVGSTGGNVAPSNTSLGRIGIGYIYTDFQPQITYTSPSMAGFQVSAGIFEPLQSLTGPGETSKSPGFQGKIVYDGKFGDFSARAWLSGITQKHNRVDGVSYTGSGFDTGAKIGYGPIVLTGYYYNGSGLGTTALNLFDTDDLGNKRDSDGFYLQGLATFGKFSVGGSYGESHLHYANLADALANPTLIDTNSSWVGQARYGLTSWVTLIGEYIRTKSEAHNGNEAKADTVALGAILFF
ncbi:porin [Sphingobium phenoxybenzoativorans]|uniref:Porin n=1 Tax=Sphingobium phenoxybenzoativorans TaxID=1592790 RepID=A0A975K6K2_9SPHN|nr:porin [Sphingobium phenoxybenzoativorans]QUT05745.1 porin [Sphingobium phenoxybenzoativorans]